MVSAVCGGIRVASLYAPNGRIVDSPWYAGKLRWFERLADWLGEVADPSEALLLGGDLERDADRRRHLGCRGRPWGDTRVRARARGTRPIA